MEQGNEARKVKSWKALKGDEQWEAWVISWSAKSFTFTFIKPFTFMGFSLGENQKRLRRREEGWRVKSWLAVTRRPEAFGRE